jgi:hypothetical protein
VGETLMFSWHIGQTIGDSFGTDRSRRLYRRSSFGTSPPKNTIMFNKTITIIMQTYHTRSAYIPHMKNLRIKISETIQNSNLLQYSVAKIYFAVTDSNIHSFHPERIPRNNIDLRPIYPVLGSACPTHQIKIQIIIRL